MYSPDGLRTLSLFQGYVLEAASRSTEVLIPLTLIPVFVETAHFMEFDKPKIFESIPKPYSH